MANVNRIMIISMVVIFLGGMLVGASIAKVICSNGYLELTERWQETCDEIQDRCDESIEKIMEQIE